MYSTSYNLYHAIGNIFSLHQNCVETPLWKEEDGKKTTNLLYTKTKKMQFKRTNLGETLRNMQNFTKLISSVQTRHGLQRLACNKRLR